MAIIKCRECGKEISDKAKTCPNCGCPQDNTNSTTLDSQSINEQESQNYDKDESKQDVTQKFGIFYWIVSILFIIGGLINIVNKVYIGIIGLWIGLILLPPFINYISKKINKKIPKSLIIAICIILLYITGTYVDDNSTSTNTTINEVNSNVQTNNTNNEENWTHYYEENQIELLSVDSELLYEYGEYYAGQNICTSVVIKEVSNDMLKADTENNTGYFFSLIFKFDNQEEIKAYKEDDCVTIAGQVAGDSSIGSTININNCHIIASGEKAQNKKKELSQNIEEQKKYVEELKTKIEAQIAEQAEVSKNEYINSCKTVNYTDVERNPSSYKGTNIKITGKVVQVSEGWFDSQTLRISAGGNYWYVTYIREDENESRILQDDNVTIYGECEGVTSYTSILGNQVTVPSLSAKYIERN